MKRRFLDFIELAPRSQKPRTKGLTTFGDRGYPLDWIRGMLEAYGDYIDVANSYEILGDPALSLLRPGSTFAPVQRFTARTAGTRVHFHWQLARQDGIAGFDLYAGSHRLNQHLIPVHGTTAYHYTVNWQKQSRFKLDVIFTDGRHLSVAPAPGKA